MMDRPVFLWKDPEPLTIARNGYELDIKRGGADILRRTAGGVWEFEDGNPVPIFYENPSIGVLGLTRYFTSPQLGLDEFDGFKPSEIEKGTIAGRPVFILNLGEVTLSIDAEHGVILAADNNSESVTATEVEFLSEWHSPAWDGEIQVPAHDTPHKKPQADPIKLPPVPTGPRNLRVLCTQAAMEGDIPDWKPGDNVGLFLTFDMNEAPLDGLMTTRRGYLEPGELYSDYRSYGFHADGWNALIYPEKPLHREEELTGYFTHCTYSNFDLWTYVVITAVYRHGPDTIIDATLDGAIPHRLQARTGGDGSITSDGETVWIAESGLPYVRGFNVDSGLLTHEMSVPCWGSISLKDGNIAWSPDKSWRLPELAELPADSSPEAPAGWEIVEEFGGNLYSLMQTIEATVGDYSGQALMQSDPYRFIELNLGTSLINEVFRYGDRIYLRTYHHFITFNQDLDILDIEAEDKKETLYSPLSDIPPGTTPRHAIRIGSLIRFRPEKDVYDFHDPETTKQIATFKPSQKQRLDIIHAAADKIVIALHNPKTRLVDSVAVWEPEKEWRTQKLDR